MEPWHLIVIAMVVFLGVFLGIGIPVVRLINAQRRKIEREK